MRSRHTAEERARRQALATLKAAIPPEVEVGAALVVVLGTTMVNVVLYSVVIGAAAREEGDEAEEVVDPMVTGEAADGDTDTATGGRPDPTNGAVELGKNPVPATTVVVEFGAQAVVVTKTTRDAVVVVVLSAAWPRRTKQSSMPANRSSQAGTRRRDEAAPPVMTLGIGDAVDNIETTPKEAVVVAAVGTSVLAT